MFLTFESRLVQGRKPEQKDQDILLESIVDMQIVRIIILESFVLILLPLYIELNGPVQRNHIN